jgi:hypothetical protein
VTEGTPRGCRFTHGVPGTGAIIDAMTTWKRSRSRTRWISLLFRPGLPYGPAVPTLTDYPIARIPLARR